MKAANAPHTVYRINDARTRELLYIGCTCQPLEKRLAAHYNEHRPTFGVDWIEWMSLTSRRKHSGFVLAEAGIRPITITAIVEADNREIGRLIETTLIQSEQPPWNTNGIPERLAENGQRARHMRYRRLSQWEAEVAAREAAQRKS